MALQTRVAMLVTFFLTALNTVIAPKFTELYSQGEIVALGRIARRFTLIITLAASPLFLTLIFFGDWALGFFGGEFALRGATALAILALGQAINTMTGSVGYLLIMTGYERDCRNSSILSMLLMCVCAMLLVPQYGIVGAAITSAAAEIFRNFYNLLMVRKNLLIWIFPSWSGTLH